MVGAGMGVAVMPRLTVNLSDPSTVALDLGRAVPPRRIVLVWHRDRYRLPAARAFIDLAAEVCAELGSAERAPDARAV